MTAEHAVILGGQKKYHRLQPGATLGTLRCGAGFRDTGREPRWKPVAEVVDSRRCRECWTKAERELTDFLLARIAEDEAAATEIVSMPDGPVTIGNKRLLADCKAKRQILALHYRLDGAAPETFPYIDDSYGQQRVVWPPCAVCDEGSPKRPYCDTVRILAAVYADHPDYREEWRP